MTHAPTDVRREQIVQALMTLLTERSYARATVAAIAREADVLPGLVHYHFKTKQEILLGVVAEIEARLQARVARRLAGAEGPWARLDALLDAHLALGEGADPRVVRCWVQLTAEALGQPEVGEVWRAALERQRLQLTEAVAAVVDLEGAEPAEVPAHVALLQSVVAGAWQLAATGAVVPRGFAAPAARSLLRLRLGGGGP